MTSKTHTGEAFSRVQRVLAELGWEPERVEGVAAFLVDFGPPHLPLSGALAAVGDEEQFLFYVNFGVEVAAERRRETEHFIALANWGLSIGNFEMDPRDGQLRFKSSVDFAQVDLSEQLIRNAILAAMRAVEAYGDALLAVVGWGISAENALAGLQK